MQIFNQIFGKIIWTVLVVILLISGYIFLVKNLVKPPQIVNNQPIPTTPPAPNANNSNPTIVQSVPDNNADLSGNILPAIAQRNGVIIEAPQKLEPGGILKIYTNTNNAEYPDPLNYNPNKVIEINGLEMVNLEKESRKFQEASGYFLVPKTGDYNFVIELPKSYKDVEIGSLNAKVDGIVLSSPNGGEIYLEEGYHSFSLLNSYSVSGDYPSINWAAIGEIARPIKVFREVNLEE